MLEKENLKAHTSLNGYNFEHNRHNFNAEIAVLGAIIIDKSKFFEASKHIKSEKFFYFEKNRLIWHAITELIKEGETVDFIMISDKLSKSIHDGAIYVSYITGITDNLPMEMDCEAYSKIVAEEFRARELYRIYDISKKYIFSREYFSIDLWKKVNEVSSSLFLKDEKQYTIHNLMEKLYTISEDNSWGFNWGIDALDKNMSQIPKGAIVIIGGRPGHCKTALATQLIDSFASRNHKIFFQSMEMSREEIDMRRLSRISGIELLKIRNGLGSPINADDDNFRHKINMAAAKIFDMERRIFISDQSGLTPEEVVLNIQVNYERYGIDMFFLDHFHRLKFGGQRELHQAQAYGLDLIVSACKNHNITSFILAQLNRSIEHADAEREPRLSDLRECGALEEVATNVLFLYWKFKKTQKEIDKYAIKILNAKSRDGSTGRIFSELRPEIYTFGRNISEHEYGRDYASK
jgi:replicative DNA helicase